MKCAKDYLGVKIAQSNITLDLSINKDTAGADKSKKFPLAHRTSEKENYLSGRKTCLPRFFFQK